MENKKVKVVAMLITTVILFSAVTIMTVNVVSADGPDHSYEYDLAADGTDDSNDWYSIVRDDDTEGGYIYVEAFIEEQEINVELENIRDVNLYFNETDISLDEYKGYLNMFGADVEITIQSDVSLLDAELHGVPNPDEVDVTGDWDGYTWEDNVFSFTNLQMSEETITLSYTSDVIDIIIFGISIYILIWFMKRVIDIMKRAEEEMN